MRVQDAPEVLYNAVTGERTEVLEDADERTVLRVRLPGHDAGPPPHRHRRHAEALTVLEGSLHVRIADDEQVVGAGQTIHVPAGTVHAWTNQSGRPVLLAQTVTPGRAWLAAVRELHALAEDDRLNRHGLPRSPVALARVCELGDIEVSGLPGPLRRVLARLPGAGGR